MRLPCALLVLMLCTAGSCLWLPDDIPAQDDFPAARADSTGESSHSESLGDPAGKSWLKDRSEPTHRRFTSSWYRDLSRESALRDIDDWYSALQTTPGFSGSDRGIKSTGDTSNIIFPSSKDFVPSRSDHGWNDSPVEAVDFDSGSGWNGDEDDDQGTGGSDDISDDQIWAREREEERQRKLAADISEDERRGFADVGDNGRTWRPSVGITVRPQEHTVDEDTPRADGTMANMSHPSGGIINFHVEDKTSAGNSYSDTDDIYFDAEHPDDVYSDSGIAVLPSPAAAPGMPHGFYEDLDSHKTTKSSAKADDYLNESDIINNPSIIFPDDIYSELTTRSPTTASASAIFSSTLGVRGTAKSAPPATTHLSSTPASIPSSASAPVLSGTSASGPGVTSAAVITCLSKCQQSLDQLSLLVEPARMRAETGTSVTVTCRATSSATSSLDMTSLEAGWRFLVADENKPCWLTARVEGEEEKRCNGSQKVHEEYSSNQTFVQSRLDLPDISIAARGLYICVASLRCCQATAHAQQLQRDVSVHLHVFTRPQYTYHLLATCAACLCLMTGLAVAAVVRRRRRRKKSSGGPLVNCHYQPVRLLKLPDVADASMTSHHHSMMSQPDNNGSIIGHDSDVDFDDDFTDAREGLLIERPGSIHVNPLSDLPLPTPPIISEAEEGVSSPREVDFPRPPSSLLAQYHDESGFD